MASATKKENFKFYSILVNFNFNSHMQLVATVLDSTALKIKDVIECQMECFKEVFSRKYIS